MRVNNSFKRHWINWLKPVLEISGAIGLAIGLSKLADWWITNGLSPTAAKLRAVLFGGWILIMVLGISDWVHTRKRKKEMIGGRE